MSKRTPYQDRTDLEKLRSQWKKLSGLASRREASAAVVRAATAAEIAANFAIRREFASRSSFDSAFVDSLLKWANGIAGKIEKLLIPLHEGRKSYANVKRLKSLAAALNSKRNAIVHQGEFCNPTDVDTMLVKARDFIETLVHLYEPTFSLDKEAL